MQILLKHVADFNHLMMRIISKKYNIKLEEMAQAIAEDPEYNKMLISPTINTLSYITQKDINSVNPQQRQQPQEKKKITVIRRLKPTQ